MALEEPLLGVATRVVARNGSAFQRAALAALKRFAEQIRERDGHATMREGMTGHELQEMLRRR